MRKILDQREDYALAQLSDIENQIPRLPQRVPYFLYVLSAALGSGNTSIASRALLVAQVAARQSFALASAHFIRQGDFETLLEICPFAGPEELVRTAVYLVRQCHDKPERFCYIALRVSYMCAACDGRVLHNQVLLGPLLRACERALAFPRNVELALSVLSKIGQEGLLPGDMQRKVEQIAYNASGRVQTAAFEVLGMASDNPGYVRAAAVRPSPSCTGTASSLVSTRQHTFRRRSSVPDQEEVRFVRELDAQGDARCDSPDCEAPRAPPYQHTWSPQHGIQRGTRRHAVHAGCKAHKDPHIANLQKFDLTAQDCQSTDLAHVNAQLKAIFGNQRDILTKQAKFDFLHFLKRTEPCLSVVEFALRIRLVGFLLAYLDDNKEVITPWLKELPHCKVYLQDKQFEQLKKCVQSAMLVQHKSYPELYAIYKQMKDYVLQYGFQKQ